MPSIWILWHRRRGDLNQMLALAEALGWPFTVKTLRFAWSGFPALASLFLRHGKSETLDPPWPDLIFCAEALCTPIALALRRRSGDKSKIVVLGRPLGTPQRFDLVITTAQYRLEPAPNVVELALPLIQARPAGRTRIDVRSPIVALVGASSAPERLDADAAEELSTALLSYSAAARSVLAVMTGPRTSAAVTGVLARRILAPNSLIAYSEDHQAGYWEYLAAADDVVVTSDSVSMVGDALSLGRPVAVYRLPRREGLLARFGEWLYAHRKSFSLAAWLFDGGVIEIPADRQRLFTKLVESGVLRWFGEAPPYPARSPAGDDLALALEAVRALVSKSAR